MCYWDGDVCNLDFPYFLSTKAPAPRSPFTSKMVSTAVKDDYVCYAHTTKAKCNAAMSDRCVWDGVGTCSFAFSQYYACPASKVMAFLQCNYFNLVAAKAPSCTASKPCAHDKARGCHHPAYSKWTLMALKQYKSRIDALQLAPSNYGCCSSFLITHKLAIRTAQCFLALFDKKKCMANTDCVWSGSSCGLSEAKVSRIYMQAYTAADAPFAAAYKKVDAECRTYKSEAACAKKTVPLDAAKLAKYRKPHTEPALDPKKYCSKIKSMLP